MQFPPWREGSFYAERTLLANLKTAAPVQKTVPAHFKLLHDSEAA